MADVCASFRRLRRPAARYGNGCGAVDGVALVIESLHDFRSTGCSSRTELRS